MILDLSTSKGILEKAHRQNVIVVGGMGDFVMSTNNKSKAAMNEKFMIIDSSSPSTEHAYHATLSSNATFSLLPPDTWPPQSTFPSPTRSLHTTDERGNLKPFA